MEEKKESLIIQPKSNIQEIIDSINEAREVFDEKDFIEDKFNEFLSAVQQSQPKAHKFSTEDDWEKAGKPVWNENDTFEDWLYSCLPEIVDNRLPELNSKLKSKVLYETSPFQRNIEQFAGDIIFDDPMEMDRFDKVYYEFMEWHLNKQKECINKFLKGEVSVLEKDLIKGMATDEIAKDVQKIAFGNSLIKSGILV